ncbi:MAG: bifunctional folylpolyglutamate synthase/dihydrofolate synthase [Balneolaceae bacterium]
MHRFQSPADLHAYLDALPMFGRQGSSAARFTLDGIRAVLNEMGNPERRYPSIHVAGTNGKGAVCRAAASICQKAGIRAGLFTSPHLLSVQERFVVDGETITETELLGLFQQLDKGEAYRNLTYFELTAALAFLHFANREVDLAIIETGLGGRLDATNCLEPVCSVITSIGFDHTDLLGDSMAAIAGEKAGIIKQGRPVVVGELEPEAMEVIRDRAEAEGSELLHWHMTPARAMLEKEGLSGVDLINSCLAVLALYHTPFAHQVTPDTIRQGLFHSAAAFQNRTTFTALLHERPWYFDAAHNAPALAVLINRMENIAPAENWTMVLHIMKDKLNPDVVKQLKKLGKVLLWEAGSPRAATLKELQKELPGAQPFPAEFAERRAWLESHKSELVIFGGSFYFYSTVMQWMGAVAEQDTLLPHIRL